MSEEIKPCPFCGGEAKHNEGGDSVYGRFWWSVGCHSCGVVLHDREVWRKDGSGLLDENYPPKECMKRWNTRAKEPETNEGMIMIEELKPCPFEWFTRRLNELNKIVAASHNKTEGISFYMSPMDIERVNEAYKAWNARANEPDTVSVDELKIYNETVTKQATLRKQAWNSCIDHLRKQYPNGIKWRE